MAPYRQALGIGSGQKLPIMIVRGSGHRFSLGAVLDETGIEHRDQLIERPKKSGRKEIIVPSSFVDDITQPAGTAENSMNTKNHAPEERVYIIALVFALDLLTSIEAQSSFSLHYSSNFEQNALPY